MREFQVYFMGLYIGWLAVNEKGQYIYCINEPFKSNDFLSRKKAFPLFTKEQKEFKEPNEWIQAIILAQEIGGPIKTGIARDIRLKEIF